MNSIDLILLSKGQKDLRGGFSSRGETLFYAQRKTDGLNDKP